MIDIIEIAKKAGINVSLAEMAGGSLLFTDGCAGISRDEFERFAALYKQALIDSGELVDAEKANQTIKRLHFAAIHGPKIARVIGRGKDCDYALALLTTYTDNEGVSIIVELPSARSAK